RLLHDGRPVTDGTWRRAWRETLDAWTTAVEASRRRFQDGASSSVGATGATGEGAAGTGIGHVARGAAVHGPQAESEVLAAWCERAAAVDPAGAPTRARAVAAARRDLARLGDPADPALVHRDLHDKQVLWQPDAPPGLLDVDTATLGDPAPDVANPPGHPARRAGRLRVRHHRPARLRLRLPTALAHRGTHPRHDPRTVRPGPPGGPRSAGDPCRPHPLSHPRVRGPHHPFCGTHHPSGR